MKNGFFKTLVIASFLVAPMLPGNVMAQYVKRNTHQSPGTATQTAQEYASRVANNCIGGRWEQQSCLKAVSENNLVMAANYGADLQKKGKKEDAEKIKEHCAAATAATQGEYPAYAMRSAFVECANMIFDIQEGSGISPDLSQYQLLVGAVQCMDKTMTCKVIEVGLQKYRK